jgi:hypothetical protein
MKKLLLIAGILVAIGLVAIVVVAFSLGSIVRNGVNRVGPQLTQSPVTLDAAQLSPFSGSGTLRGLHVGNPSGWSGDKAFSLGEVRLDLEPRSLWAEAVVIEELVIQRPEFVYEQRLTGGSNIKDLIENIRKAVGTPAERPIGEPEQPPKKFIIKSLRLQDGLVRVGLGPAAATVPLPELSYENLGVKEGGLTGAQIANVVLSDVLGRVITVATSKGLLSLPSGAAGQTLEAVGSGLQKIFGGRKDAPAPEEKKKENR